MASFGLALSLRIIIDIALQNSRHQISWHFDKFDVAESLCQDYRSLEFGLRRPTGEILPKGHRCLGRGGGDVKLKSLS